MLATIEAYFLSALGALGSESTLLAGPLAAGDGAPATACIAVWAAQLTLLAPSADAVRGARRSVREFQRSQLLPQGGAASDQLDFVIPPELAGDLGEVERSPGVPARPDDDYVIDQRTIHFFRPPQAPVGITLYGRPAQGYVSRRPCQIEVSVRIRAAQAERAEALLRTVVSTLLLAAAELTNLEVVAPAGASVRLRLLAPTAALTTVRRYAEPPAATHGACAEWTIWGDLEETVVLGTPVPVEQIASIKYNKTGLDPKK